MLSHVQLFATPWTVTYNIPPSMEFSRQEYWSELPFPSPGNLPDPGIEPGSPVLQADTFTLWDSPEERKKPAKTNFSFQEKKKGQNNGHFQTCKTWENSSLSDLLCKKFYKKKMLQRNPSGRRKMTVFGNLYLHKWMISTGYGR